MNDGGEDSVKVVEAVVKYRRMIEAYANAIVRDFHLSEDIYQEVALIVAKNSGRLPPGDEMLPWIREITRRKSLEALRRRKRMPALLSEETLMLVAEQMGEEGTGESDDDRRSLMQRCLERLGGAAREAMRLRYGEERSLSCEEVAARMNRSVKAVYNLLVRSRAAVLRCVEQEKGRYVAG